MKIKTRIIVTAERADGGKVTLARTIISTRGDNPSFERNESAVALREATEEFISANALSGTRPL